MYKIFNSNSRIYKIFIDRENLIWIPTEDGIVKATPVDNKDYSFNHTTSNNEPFSPENFLYYAKDGSELFLDWTSGIYSIKNEIQEKILDFGKNGQFIRREELDKNGNLIIFGYISSYFGEFKPFKVEPNIFKIDQNLKITQEFDGDLKTSFHGNEKVSVRNFKVLDNSIIFISNSGCYVKDNSPFIFYPIDTTIYPNPKKLNCTKLQYQLYSFTTSDSLKKYFSFDFRTKQYNLIHFQSDTIINDRSLFFSLESNKLIISNNNYLTIQEENSEKHYYYPKEGDKSVNFQPFSDNALIHDSGHVIYYHRNSNYFICFNSKKGVFQHFKTSNKVNLDNILNMAFSPDSTSIIIQTDKITNKIEVKTLIEQHDIAVKSWAQTNRIFSHATIAFSNDSILTIYGTSGITRINIKNSAKKAPPTVFITSISLYDTYDWVHEKGDQLDSSNGYSIPNNFELDHNQNKISFFYKGIYHTDDNELQYEYQLEGEDNKTTLTSNTSVTYSNLAPGSYSFIVNSVSKNGFRSEKQSIYFEISHPWTDKIWAKLVGLILIILVLFSIIRLNSRRLRKKQIKLEQIIQNATTEIRNQKEAIEEAHQEILDSLTYAKRIQTAILPTNKLVKEYIESSFILYKPKDIVAGDFYWMEPQKSGVLFAAADCTGHGVPGAMVSVVCHNALNRSVREFGLTEPGKILDKTREIVIQEFEKSEEDVKDGMDIALCSIVGNNLKYAGAHNALWLIRNNEILETKANKQPIGKFDKIEPYITHHIELQQNDTLYIFSDGYIDQFGGPKGKKLKAKLLRELLLSIQHLNMDQQHSKINQAFEDWKGDLEQVDDVCMIGVRIV